METVLEKPFPAEAALLQSSQAIHLSEGDERAAGGLSKGHAESRQRDLTAAAVVFGHHHPHGSQGSGCILLENQSC